MTENSFYLSFSTLLPFAITLFIATLGWIFTYLHSKYRENKKNELSLVNQQLRLLYGPLYARLLAGNAAWKAFADENWPTHGQEGYFTEGFQTTELEMETWRLWMRHVFHPMNKKLEQIIVDHLDLVQGGNAPQSFIETLAHISVYNAVLQEWDNGNYINHTSVINFPFSSLINDVKPVYFDLIKKQLVLLKT